MQAVRFGWVGAASLSLMALITMGPSDAAAQEPIESSYRMSLGGGVSDVGAAARVGIEAENWIKPGLGIGGRFAYGRDIGGGLSRNVSTVAFGLRGKAMESESGFLSFGLSAGITHLGAAIGDTSGEGSSALARPRDDNPAFANSLGECTGSGAGCGGFGLSPNFRGNLGLDAGWVMTKAEKRDTHLFLRAQTHGLPLSGDSTPNAYALSFNIGFGDRVSTPGNQPMPNITRGY